MPDFTDEAYAALLDAGLDAGYEFLTVREYFSNEELPDRFIVVRHDVDRKPMNSLQMARTEAVRDISTTYYFRIIPKTFRPSIIRATADLGHEVGYHYEDLDTADGDVDAAHDSFERNLRRFRRICDVDTICMHGNPLTAHDNRDMWTGSYTYEQYGLLGEAYLSMDFEEVTYFSDTGRTWMDGPLKVKDHTMGQGTKHVQADSTWDLIDILAARQVDRACLLVHPNRWAGSYAELLSERTKDAATNVVKYGLQLRP
ncbi:hypothetical protein ACNS7O_18190 (plasmid) [Haloferacaceae archaeon DSL9]